MTKKKDVNIDVVRKFVSFNWYPLPINRYRMSRTIAIIFAVLGMVITTWYSLDVRKGKVDIFFLMLFFVIITVGSLYAENNIRNRMLTDHNGHILDVFIYNTACLPPIIFPIFVLIYIFIGFSATIILVLGYFSSLVVGVVIAKKSINHALRTDIDNAFAIKFMNFLENEYRRPILIILMIVICKNLGMTGMYIASAIGGLTAICNATLWEQMRLAKEYNCEEWLPNGTTVEN